MKVALITGGQPRFTPDFINVLNQLQGFDTADIYMCLWSSEWATTDDQARAKIEKVLPPRYKLAKVEIVEQPQYVLPLHSIELPVESPENVRWFYKRRFAQAIALTLTFDLINQDYDAVVRFRLDGRLGNSLDLSKQDLTREIILPANSLAGHEWAKINDQFAIASQAEMKFYCGIGKEFPNIVSESDPLWETNSHGQWSLEHLMGMYYKKYQKSYRLGNFEHYINTQGRSRFTDKHYHHGIVEDPTN